MDLYPVIGDMVGSRRLDDRSAAQDALAAVLSEVNRSLSPAQAFEPTVGDEFQGACVTAGQALVASLVVRLTLRPWVDTRVGIGHGALTVHDADRRPLLQDGPGWWAARDALDSLSGVRRSPRTAYQGPDEVLVNAYLICRDQLLSRLNDRGLRMVRLALLGATQREIAAAEGVSASAVSQQFGSGVGAVVESARMLDALADPAPSGLRP